MNTIILFAAFGFVSSAIVFCHKGTLDKNIYNIACSTFAGFGVGVFATLSITAMVPSHGGLRTGKTGGRAQL